MHILNDFFLLNWNEKLEHIDDLPKQFATHIYDDYSNYSDFCDSSAILLLINSENCDDIIKLSTLKEIFDGIFSNIIFDKCLILQAQKELLRFLVEEGNLELNKDIKSRFEILRKEGVITYFISRRLIGLLGLIKEKESKKVEIKLKEAEKSDNFYTNGVTILKTAITNLESCLEIESFKRRIKEIALKLDNQKFSMGVTGVMNAGKSTMLNALLKREILGTATVPETANLTILKYSDVEFARVNFWKKSEFERIEKSAKSSKSIEKFIKETKEHFKNEIGKYITTVGNSKEIAIDELVFYTSAKKSDKKCNLVKSVELYSSLEFLKQGVEIVDTPGLDDPIVQREEITLEYLNDCDLMCHLMNVNQSATKKDIDFIIDSILYNNIARLLIVITRIDTVSKDELNEVIEYTKNSIFERLKEQNRDNRFDFIIEKVDFIPLSGKMALLHRIGKSQEALKKGYSLDKTGILRLEEYLKQTLFGKDSSKVDLIIRSNSKELKSIIQSAVNLLKDEKDILTKSEDEIRDELKDYQIKMDNLTLYFNRIKDTLKNVEIELNDYIKMVERFADSRLKDLRDLVKQRILDDVSYEIRKNKKIPKRERIDYIVRVGLKDGLIDLIRDYRYEYQKRVLKSVDEINRSFNELENLEEFKNDFDTKTFFENNFKTFLSFVHEEMLLEKIYKLIKEYGKKDLDRLNEAVLNLLDEEIKEIRVSLKDKLNVINKSVLDGFISYYEGLLDRLEEDIKLKEDMLKKSIEAISKSSMKKRERVDEIEAKLEALDRIEEDLDKLKEVEN